MNPFLVYPSTIPDAHPVRPWWHREILHRYPSLPPRPREWQWRRNDGVVSRRVTEVDALRSVDGGEEAHLAAIDVKEPLAPPIALVGQVWYFPRLREEVPVSDVPPDAPR